MGVPYGYRWQGMPADRLLRNGIAVHTDICTPVATNQTWSQIKSYQLGAFKGGFELWEDLVEELAPEIVIFSVGSNHLGRRLTNRPVPNWPVICTVTHKGDGKAFRSSPFYVHSARLTIGKHLTRAVWGNCHNVPFGSVSHVDKHRIGEAIRRKYMLTNPYISAGSARGRR